MSSVKISQLPAADQILTPPDVIFPIVQDGITKKANITQISPAGELISAVSSELHTLVKGMPVALVDGKLRRARSTAPFNKIVGLVFENSIVPGQAGRVQTSGKFEMPPLEWEAATGMVGGLSPADTYFVSDLGFITPWPTTTSGEYVIPVGRAISPSTLNINLTTQVLL